MPEQRFDRPIAGHLADWASRLRLADVPAQVVRAARRVLVDSVGVVLAGVNEPELRAMARRLTRGSAAGDSAVPGLPVRTDARTAALISGTAGVWHDLDPGNRWLGGHPAAHVVPAALAVAEPAHASGAALVEAVIAGYEVASAVGHGTTLRPELHPHGTWPTIGAATAVARLVHPGNSDLLRESMIVGAALSLATSWNAALTGATVRNVYAGAGAANGVLAAELAAAGITGPADGIEDVYGAVAGTCDFDAGRACPGEDWMLLRGYHKLHACARYLHPAVDALREITATGPVDPDDVERIEVTTFTFAAGMNDPAPATPLAARFSLPYALAVWLVRHDTGLDAFGETAIQDAATRALAARIVVSADPAMDAGLPGTRPATVALIRRDGRRQSASVRQARGEPDNRPVTDDEIEDKFLTLAARTLGDVRARRLCVALSGIESVRDVGSVLALAYPA